MALPSYTNAYGEALLLCEGYVYADKSLDQSLPSPTPSCASLISHPIQAGEDPGRVATARSCPRRTIEVPAEVLVGICGAVARAVCRLHGVEGLVDLLFGDALYLGADGGYGRRLGGQVAHYGEYGGRRVPALLAEDVRALLAH